MRARNVEVIVVDTKEQALQKIKEIIPAGASVMNGSSTSLKQIGFVEYLKSAGHGWNNLHAGVVAETDKEKQAVLRQNTIFADYWLGSVHAITEAGETVTASASGSQLPSYAHTSKNLIWVASANKITPTLDLALTRIREYVVPLEDARMKSVDMGGTNLAKILIYENEPAFTGRKIYMILVKEKLGF